MRSKAVKWSVGLCLRSSSRGKRSHPLEYVMQQKEDVDSVPVFCKDLPPLHVSIPGRPNPCFSPRLLVDPW